MPSAHIITTITSPGATAPEDTTVTRNITFANAGPDPVIGLVVTLANTGATVSQSTSWTATGIASTPSGTGYTSHTLNLAVGASAQIALRDKIQLGPAVGSVLVLTTTLTFPAGTTDPTPSGPTTFTLPVTVGSETIPVALPIAPYVDTQLSPFKSQNALGKGDLRPADVSIQSGVCHPWITAQDVKRMALPHCNGKELTDDQAATVAKDACDLLFAVTARQFRGACRDVIRPIACNDKCSNSTLLSSTLPLSGLGRTFLPTQSCSGSALHEIDLVKFSNHFPIRRINRLIIQGVVQDPSTYQIQDWRYLVRTPNAAFPVIDKFPCCQRLDFPTSEADTWEVDFMYGKDAPGPLMTAAMTLAVELAKAFTNNPCNLPKRATSVTRQNTTINLIDTRGIEEGRTGIWEIDYAVKLYNPNKLRQSAMFYSPDTYRSSRRTTTF